jgi:hypothetical protein
MFKTIFLRKSFCTLKTFKFDTCTICLTPFFCNRDKNCIYDNSYDILYNKNIINTDIKIIKKDNTDEIDEKNIK